MNEKTICLIAGQSGRWMQTMCSQTLANIMDASDD